MIDVANIILLVSLVTMVVNVPFYFTFIWRLNSYLKHHYVDTWEEMGSFELITNNSLSNSIAFLRFIVKKHYLAMNDNELKRRGDQSFLSLATAIVSFALSSALLFLTANSDYF